MSYHHGGLLTDPISLHLIFYGKFNPSQRAVIADFVTSFSSSKSDSPPSVSMWFRTLEKYYFAAKIRFPRLALALAPEQILDESCSLGRSLTDRHIAALASKGDDKYTVNIVMTADDVSVDGFCMSRCGTHGSSPRTKAGRYAYIWVGNSATQCPGQCAWPSHQPVYNPLHLHLHLPLPQLQRLPLHLHPKTILLLQTHRLPQPQVLLDPLPPQLPPLLHQLHPALPPYFLLYGSGSTAGILLSETHAFSSNLTSFPNFALGCSLASDSQPSGGVAGFGRGSVSLPSQIKRFVWGKWGIKGIFFFFFIISQSFFFSFIILPPDFG